MTLVSQAELVAGAIAGRVVSFPTDTVPALAVLPERAEQIFDLKKRPRNKALILMGSSAQDLWPFVAGTAEERNIWERVASRYWPGPLTLVLPVSSNVSAAINPTSATIALRVPSAPCSLAILAQTGPLATTSANLSGEAPLQTLTAVEVAFPNILVLDSFNKDEKYGSGLPSTLAKWTGKDWEILRQGIIREISNDD